VTRLGYKLVNIGGFFREEDIKYSPCNLKHLTHEEVLLSCYLIALFLTHDKPGREKAQKPL
jgi:hypothetical protein